MTESLNIIYEDDWLLAVDKPSGLLMHPSWLDRKEKDTLASRVKIYLNSKGDPRKVHTVHRLDRPTSGLVLIAKDDEAAKNLADQFKQRSVKKVYWAICRGFTTEAFSIDYALKEEIDKIADKNASKDKEAQSAQTNFKRLGICEVAIPVSRYNKSRFSWVECSPETGRKHQIRRHLKHIRHPIIGDTKYGCRHYNKTSAENLGVESLALRAVKLTFLHPVKSEVVELNVPLSEQWVRLLNAFSWKG